MQTRNRGNYTIAGCELIAEGADLRVQVLSLAAGQCVPWHYHSEISDSFVCLEGAMVVETRARVRLCAGWRVRLIAPAPPSLCREGKVSTSLS